MREPIDPLESRPELQRSAAALRRVLVVLIALCVMAPLGARAAQADAVPPRAAGAKQFEPQIVEFEEQDREAPPVPGAILFTGSSSIRMWSTLARDMEPLRAINRGFGGSKIAQVDYYAERVIEPYAPRAVVLYAGDNDLAAKAPKTPKEVVRDFRLFVKRVQQMVPDAPIFFLAIKPSLARWDRWPEMRLANKLISSVAEEEPGVEYVDVATPMLGADGKPNGALFIADGLHMNAAGYALWTEIVKPVLERETPEPESR